MYKSYKKYISKFNNELGHNIKIIDMQNIYNDLYIICDNCNFQAVLKNIFIDCISYRLDDGTYALISIKYLFENKEEYLCNNIILKNIL